MVTDLFSTRIRIGILFAWYSTLHVCMSLQGERMKEANWKDLCEAIVEERDSQKLISLVHQLNDVLDGGNLTLQPENDAKGE